MVCKFVISIKENNQARQKHIREVFSKAETSFLFFDAITPRRNKEIIDKYDLGQFNEAKISEGAISCFLSHYLLWNKIVEEELEYAFIFEDDIFLGEDACAIFNATSIYQNLDFDIIKIEKGVQEYIATDFLPYEKVKNRKLFRLTGSHYGCGGYLTSNKGAKYLLDKCRELRKIVTVDKFLFEELLKSRDFKVFQMLPALCIQDCVLNPHENNFPTSLPFQSSFIKVTLDNQENKQYDERIILTKKLLRELLRPFKQLKKRVVRYVFFKKNVFK